MAQTYLRLDNDRLFKIKITADRSSSQYYCSYAEVNRRIFGMNLYSMAFDGKRREKVPADEVVDWFQTMIDEKSSNEMAAESLLQDVLLAVDDRDDVTVEQDL